MELMTDNTYSCTFDKESWCWTENFEYNKVFLYAQRNFANNKLQSHGFIFLNDILSSLELKLVSKGQLIGWTRNGMGYVDFVIEDNEEDNSFQLTFNTDGDIHEQLDSML